MNKLKFLAAFIFSFIFSLNGVRISAAAESNYAKIVMEASSNRVLYGENINTRLPMASTTKILTAIIVIEDCNLKDELEIPPEAEGVEGSSVYLKSGEIYTIEELLYGLMLRSGNDCSVALAVFHSGSVSEFVKEMNERAKKIGAKESNFTNPNGLPDDKHYTTAYDLALITSYAMNNATFREIVSTKYYEKKGWSNKNKMLYSYVGANGVKTGYTVRAGKCLVSSAKRDGMQLVCAVLNVREAYEVSERLLNDAFSNYSMIKLIGVENYSLQTDIEYKSAEIASLRELYYPLSKEELSEIKIERNIPTKINLPLRKGETVGNIKIYFLNRLIFFENLCSIKDVNVTFKDILLKTAKGFV